MQRDEIVKRTRERAKDYFKTGMNCTECVFQAVYDEGLSNLPPQVIALATGFGGGMGLTGNNCGALTGAILAASSVHGRPNPHEKESPKERILQLIGEKGRYRLFNIIPHRFKAEFGEIDCAKLVEPFEWESKGRRELCQNLIGEGAALAIFWILEGLEKGYGMPFGDNVAGIEENSDE